MTTNGYLICILILIIAYFLYQKSKETFLEKQIGGNLQLDLASSGRSGKNMETFLEKQMNGNLQVNLASGNTGRSGNNLESFSSQGRMYPNDTGRAGIPPEGSFADESGAGVYTEFLRASVDPSLQARQNNFIKDMNDGHLEKNTYSAVNTSKYIAREAEAPMNVIGIRPVRSVQINYNQKQVPETLPEDSYADEDPSLAASVIGVHHRW